MDKGKDIYNGQDVAKAIDLYYTRFAENGENLIFTDHSIEFLGAKILEAENYVNDTAQLKWKDTLRMQLKFKNISLTHPPYFILTIFDKEQRPVAQIQQNEKQEKGSLEKEIDFEILLQNVLLSKGIYSINISVQGEDTGEPLLRVNNILSFQIIHKDEIWPPFLLESKFIGL